MSRRKGGGGDEGGNWMDTYGDMVTLLMTFFVLLYSMSNLDAKKWEVFVRSINPDKGVDQAEQVAVNGVMEDVEDVLDGGSDIPEQEVFDTEQLYLILAEELERRGVDGVELSRGEDYTFIVFQDRTFFGGDSSELTDPGREVLDVFCDVLDQASDQISQINIMGHTTQADPNRPNYVREDRMLSSMRAAEVCIFIQQREVIEPDKLVTIGYGQFRPLDTADTDEARARNRRVELLLVDEGADTRSLNEYYEEYLSGTNADRTIVTDGNKNQEQNPAQNPDLPEGEIFETLGGADSPPPEMELPEDIPSE